MTPGRPPQMLLRLTAVAQVTRVMLRLVVNPHVVGDVGGRQQLPADVTGNLLLVPDQVGAEPIPRGERRRAGLQRGDRKSAACRRATRS